MKKRTIFIIIFVLIVACGGFYAWSSYKKNSTPRESTTVGVGTINRTISKECSVDFSRLVTITSEVSGEVKDIKVSDGKTVKDGSTVVVIDSALNDNYKAKSTISGTVAKVLVREHEVVAPGTPLFVAFNRNTAQISCKMSDVEFADLQIARQKKLFKASTTYNGKVYGLGYQKLLAYPEQTQVVYELVLSLPKSYPQERKQIGFTATVDMQIDQVKDATTIPLKFLGADQDGEFVTLRNATNQYEKKYITTGITDGTSIVVEEGLTKDQTIFVNTP